MSDEEIPAEPPDWEATAHDLAYALKVLAAQTNAEPPDVTEAIGRYEAVKAGGPSLPTKTYIIFHMLRQMPEDRARELKRLIQGKLIPACEAGDVDRIRNLTDEIEDEYDGALQFPRIGDFAIDQAGNVRGSDLVVFGSDLDRSS